MEILVWYLRKPAVTIIVKCRELSQPDLYETDSEQGGRCSQTYTVVVTRKAC